MAVALSLRLVLEAIHSAGIGGGERRRLSVRAVAFALGVAEPVVQAEVLETPFLALHDALDMVASAVGVEVVTITEANTILRGTGASGLASRLSRLSKVRNHAAHPDFSLLDDLRDACAQLPQAKAGSGQGLERRQ